MKIRDDRGGEVTTSRRLVRWRSSPRIVWTPKQDGELSVWAVSIGLIAFFGMPIVLGYMVKPLSAAWGGIAALVVGYAWVFAAALFFRRYLLRTARAQAIGRGECAACGYSIKEITPQEDGCRVCPECGGAWRV